MLIYEGAHKCVTFSEVRELEDFILDKAVKRNNSNFKLDIMLALDGDLVKHTEKGIESLCSTYTLHGKIVLKTELAVVNAHKGAFVLTYKVMDWS